MNKDDKSPKADRGRTKVRHGRLSTIRNRNITIVDRIRRIPTLLTASQYISILRSWRFYNTLAVQNACSCVFSPVLICLSVVPRKSSTKRKRALPVVSSSKQEFVFSRTCAGKRHIKSRERGDRKGANGGKREGERSEQESVVPCQNKISRRVGGHAPPQRHLERSAATTKTRFTGRKQNKRKRILLSSRRSSLSSRPSSLSLRFFS